MAIYTKFILNYAIFQPLLVCATSLLKANNMSKNTTTKSKKVEEKSQPKSTKPTPKSKPKTKSQAAPKSKTAKSPQTMDELLASTDYTFAIPKKGDTVKGVITHKGKKMLSLDIGAKTEGLVVDKEYALAREYIDDLKEGQEVSATVVAAETNQGQILLSLRKAAQDSKWGFFEEACKEDRVLETKGVDVNKGGLIVEINGTRGFVPSSQFGKKWVGKYAQLQGETVKVKVIEVDRDKNRLIFSERHVSEAEEIAQKEKALQSVKSDEIYEGVISGVMPFGLFVTVEVPVDKDAVGHVEGLVHISEISWEKVSHPKDYHQVGDRIKVRVLGVDENTGKLNLSIKQLTNDPWQDIDERFQPGMTVSGKVSRVESFGVFVNVEEGVDGLVHASKLDPNRQLTVGEEITVHVENVDPKQRRMSLSLVLTELPVGYK